MHLHDSLRRALALLALFAAIAWGPATAADYALPPPVAGDFQTVLANRTDVPVVFDFGGRATILIVDFPTLAEQGRMFNRVGALVERMGAPRERVLNNDELAAFIRSVGKTEATFAYGNDFLVSELVVFFNLADTGGIQLNGEEIALRQLLVDRRLASYRNGFYQALRPNAVILSLPQERPGSPGNPPVGAMARRTILMHEISHAEFYSNPKYANYCRQFWVTVLTESQRAAFRKFLSHGSYNPDNEEMMINETQAYLIYTPDPGAFSAKLVGLKERDLEQLRQRFLAGYPEAPLSSELRR